MSEQTNRGLAYDPQDLERMLVSRQNVGDVDGMAALYEPQALLEVCESLLTAPTWSGRRVLVTAGGTREPIDSVRYIGNRSSGRMGFALAARAAARGAHVALVAANVALPSPDDS